MPKHNINDPVGNRPLPRLNLTAVNDSLQQVEVQWQSIDNELDRHSIGRKDTPFNTIIRAHMLSAYVHLDHLLERKIMPFSKAGLPEMVALNNCVHYGTDANLMREYRKAIQATEEKFQVQIAPLVTWYHRHPNSHPLKLAAEIYVGILGYPQLFIEGNHRTGTLIASWINMVNWYPPFVLSIENAIPFFQPSSEIKNFGDKSTWRGRRRLPKYRKSFGEFWEKHIEEKYMIQM